MFETRVLGATRYCCVANGSKNERQLWASSTGTFCSNRVCWNGSKHRLQHVDFCLLSNKTKKHDHTQQIVFLEKLTWPLTCVFLQNAKIKHQRNLVWTWDWLCSILNQANSSCQQWTRRFHPKEIFRWTYGILHSCMCWKGARAASAVFQFWCNWWISTYCWKTTFNFFDAVGFSLTHTSWIKIRTLVLWASLNSFKLVFNFSQQRTA